MKELSKLQLQIIILILIFLILLIIRNEYIGFQGNEHNDVIRFHVIANSNSKEDQELKLKVRDGLLEKVQLELSEEILDGNSDNIITTRRYVNDNVGKINNLAKEIILENGYEYGVTTKLELVYIPEKSYGNTLFPEGCYEALNIKIGKGKGENWWCVLFPPLCLIDADNEIYKNKLGKDDKDKIILKSKVGEIARKYRKEI